ncbi:hypothetical protein DFH07DRAFT_978044 [Mycena maculata]|uniref:Uncharacterized protein n=1 Tax=Mycena maculata TaxID=230809 RepID=A0AAD7IJS1_9AGAR|nr:hypothetical protein DFH07DRAFT_978044 [Mycena maculata]
MHALHLSFKCPDHCPQWEIEQPFGYEDNDLDLDMFCRDIIRQDLQCLRKAPCLNAWFPPAAPSVLPSAANGSGKDKGTHTVDDDVVCTRIFTRDSLEAYTPTYGVPEYLFDGYV